MEGLLQISPGLIIWTLVNFSLYLFILAKFGYKPLRVALERREQTIAESLRAAEHARSEAQRLLADAEEQRKRAHAEMVELLRNARQQAERIVTKAAEEGELVKQEKLREAEREIERMIADARAALRGEVAELALQAAQRLLAQQLDSEQHRRLVEQSLAQLERAN
ncbi:MAG: F0F1 ATP synthase subunit B [Chlorobi bacterium]|nr:F0F1 ATP synthase subunit B [Chlorobiota bacterium]